MKRTRAFAPLGLVVFAATLGGCAVPMNTAGADRGPIPFPAYCLGNNTAITAALGGAAVGVGTGLISHNAAVGGIVGILAGGLTYAVLESNCQQVATHNALVQAEEEAEAAQIAAAERDQELAAAKARREEHLAELRREHERAAALRARVEVADDELAQERAAKQQADAELAAARVEWSNPITKTPEKIVADNSYTDPAGDHCIRYHKITYVGGVPQIGTPNTTCQSGTNG